VFTVMQNFIQLSLTLKKLCPVKCDHLVNFYIFTWKTTKMRYLCNSLISTNVIVQNVSLKWLAVKNFNSKIQRWRTAAILKINKLQCLMMMQNGSLKHIGHPPFSILKWNFLMGGILETRSASSCQILWWSVMLWLKYCNFHIFHLKCKN